ncbi:MAG: LLM class flavin-dependent oxidoreductase [Dehalococcoidia bacterium]|nr:LLM class flavin-dependent oxidoreductase [Dehalococcoidia bacterium]
MKDLTIGVHMLSRDGKGAVEQIRQAEQWGVDVAWMTCGGVAPDPLAVFSAAAMQTDRIEFGTCIIPTFPRHPMALAQEAIVVDSLAPGRLRLGVGPSHEPAMRNTWGLDFTRPLEHLREYVTILNQCFKDGKVSFQGKRLHAEAQFAAPADVRVMVSALRHKAFSLAGELTEGGISRVTPPEHIRDVAVPALKEGAAKAGRDTVPPAIVHAPVIVSTDTEAVYQQAVQQVGFYQRLPFYEAMWVEAGYEEAKGEEFTRRMFEGLIIHGDEQQVADRIRGLKDYGAGEIIAMPLLLQNDRQARDRTVKLMGELAKGD